MDVTPVWVALTTGQERPPTRGELMRALGELRAIQHRVDLMNDEGTVVFRKELVAVEIVKDEGDLPGKARLVLVPDEGKDEPETIETNWLTDPWARLISENAQQLIGRPIAVWKHNTEPDENAPQGYRRCVWVEGALPPAPAGGITPATDTGTHSPEVPGPDSAHTQQPAKAELPDLTELQQKVLAGSASAPNQVVAELRVWRTGKWPDLEWPWPDEICEQVLAKREELMEGPF